MYTKGTVLFVYMMSLEEIEEWVVGHILKLFSCVRT